MRLRPGDILGRYTILGALGAGGMGEVYRARDARLEREVAIKLLRSVPGTDASEGSARLLREARAAASLEHPNAIAVFDVGEVEGHGPLDGTPYIAMELVRGSPLRAFVGKTEVPMATRVRWLADVARALGAAHVRGLVHRDIKPENVMVRDDGAIKVLDFGLARRLFPMADSATSTEGLVLPTLTAHGVVVGTPRYMAPEQMRGEVLDGRTDQFSWGVMAYEVLTGLLPWGKDIDALQLVAAVLSKDPEPLLAPHFEVPPLVAMAVMRALSKRPDQRFGAMSEVIRALEDRGDMGSDPLLSPAARSVSDVPRRRMAEPLGGPETVASSRGERGARGAPAVQPAGGAGPSTLASPGMAPLVVVTPAASSGASSVRGPEPEPSFSELALSGPSLAEPVVPESLPARSSSDDPAATRLSPGATVPISGPPVPSLAAPPPSEPMARARSARRRPVALFVAGGVAVVAAVGAFLATRHAKDAVPAVAAPLRDCEHNRDCKEKDTGGPALCRKTDGRCVSLASEDCHPLFAPSDLDDDDTLWIGSLFPLTGPDGVVFGRSNAQAVDLARQDFAQVAESFRGEGSSVHLRPIAHLSCDDAASPARAARHLVETVGVPAVIGFRTTSELVSLANSLFLPKGVLSLAALNMSPVVTNLPQKAGQPRLVWRTTYNSAHTAQALGAFVEKSLEPEARRLSPKTPVRVLFLRYKNTAGVAFADALFRVLRFNGKSALDNGTDFREIPIGEAPNATELENAAKEIVAFRPQVVLYAVGGSVVHDVIAPAEDAWPKSLPHRPVYATMNAFPSDLFAFIGKNAERRRRFFGIATVSATTANARFVQHYNETFADVITRTVAPNSSYDAFYIAAYAAYLAPRGTMPNGEALARQIPKLRGPGKRVEAGPSGIYDAIGALGHEEPFDFVGATGDLDLDPQTGESAFDQVILCVGTDDDGRAIDGFESGLVFDARGPRLTGTLKCP